MILILVAAFFIWPSLLEAQEKIESTSQRLELAPYAFENVRGEKLDAELGRLLVPENRHNPRSRSIEIAFIRFKSKAKEPGPPLIYLEGGPGGSGIDAARNQAFASLMAMREFGDVIALDQRATGMSKPGLDCSVSWEMPLDIPGEGAVARKSIGEKIRVCLQELKRQGVDPAGYNNNENADDIEDLRVALGYPKVRLWGVSYGTLLGLTTLRRHENSIDRLILSGVLAPNQNGGVFPSTVQEQLVKVDALFKSDPEVNKLMPDFQGLVKSLLEKLDQPVIVEVDNPQTRQKVKVAVDKTDLQLFTSYSTTYSYGIMTLPNFLYPLSKGDWTPLARRALEHRRGPLGSLMGPLMICSSGVTYARKRRLEAESKQSFLLGNAINIGAADLCEALGNDLGKSYREPVRSKVPVLLISGTLDGTTPLINAEEVRRGLPNSTHLIVEGAGHGWELFYFTPEVRAAMLAFLKGEPLGIARAHSSITLIPVQQ